MCRYLSEKRGHYEYGRQGSHHPHVKEQEWEVERQIGYP